MNDFFYIGGQLNTSNLPGNQFVNFAAIGLTELPSAFIGKFFMNRIGRIEEATMPRVTSAKSALGKFGPSLRLHLGLIFV